MSASNSPEFKAFPTGGPYFHSTSITSKIFSTRTHTWESCAGKDIANINGKPLQENDTLNILTWNINFGPFAKQRCGATLDYLQETLSSPPYNTSAGTVILLQEVYGPDDQQILFFRVGAEGSALAVILDHKWIQQEFLAVDITFPGNYGTVTLVSQNLAIATTGIPRGCFRVPNPTSFMGRDILSTDLVLENGGILRICNVHLESLSGHGTKARPLQLALVSKLLKQEGISAGIVGGDMNAIEPPDFVLHRQEDIQLKDVWVEFVGEEVAIEKDNEFVGRKGRVGENDGSSTNWGDAACHTWGYNSEKTIFYPRRMDKVLFCNAPEANLSLVPVKGGAMERLGIQKKVKVEFEKPSKEAGEEVDEDEYCDFLHLSDHFGLLTRFVVVKN